MTYVGNNSANIYQFKVTIRSTGKGCGIIDDIIDVF